MKPYIHAFSVIRTSTNFGGRSHPWRIWMWANQLRAHGTQLPRVHSGVQSRQRSGWSMPGLPLPLESGGNNVWSPKWENREEAAVLGWHTLRRFRQLWVLLLFCDCGLLHSSSWSQTHYVTLAGFEPVIFLPEFQSTGNIGVWHPTLLHFSF